MVVLLVSYWQLPVHLLSSTLSLNSTVLQWSDVHLTSTVSLKLIGVKNSSDDVFIREVTLYGVAL